MLYVAVAIAAMSSAFSLTSCDKLFGGHIYIEPPSIQEVDTIKTAAGDDSLIITTYDDGNIDTVKVGETIAPEGEDTGSGLEVDGAEPTVGAIPTDGATAAQAPADTPAENK